MGRFVLPAWFLLLLTITVGNGIRIFLLRERSYHLSGWLTSYHAGFVRRGLSGEIVYRVADWSGVSPAAVVLVIQILAYLTIFAGAFLLLRRLPRPLPAYAWLAVFAPWAFLYHVHDPIGGYRPDALALALLVLVGVFVVRASTAATQRVVVITTLLFVPLVLIHELLVVFLPYVLALASRVRWSRRDLMPLLVALAFVVLATAAAAIWRGTAEQANAICLQMMERVQLTTTLAECRQRGAVAWLALDAGYGFQLVRAQLSVTAPQVLAALGLIGVGLGPLLVATRRLVDPASRRALLWGALVSWVLIAPIFVVAVDWGRFLHLQATALLITALALLARSGPVDPWPLERRQRLLLVIGTLVYATTWHIALDARIGGGLFS